MRNLQRLGGGDAKHLNLYNFPQSLVFFVFAKVNIYGAKLTFTNQVHYGGTIR